MIMVKKAAAKSKKVTEERGQEAARVEYRPAIVPEEMLNAYLHFGHRRTITHPRMKPFIYTVRNSISIIDLEKTKQYLEEALMFVARIVAEGGRVLFVATHAPATDLIRPIARDLGMFYVAERWLGGTFTNFKTVAVRLSYLKDLEEKKKGGDWEKYTKKEQHDFEEELTKLRRKFEGIQTMEKLPDAIFILTLSRDILPAKEARSVGIPVIAVCDTNADPALADYPIPANDDAVEAVGYVLEKVSDAIKHANKKSS